MKEVGIEEFAAWAVQEEWPKARSEEMDEHGAMRATILSAMGFRGTPLAPAGYGAMDWSLLVGDGAVPAMRVAGVPHADALLFSEACNALHLEAGSPAYDVDDCLSDQVSVMTLAQDERHAANWRASQQLRCNDIAPRSLVLSYAALARPRRKAHGWEIVRPDWHEDALERGYVRGDSGRGQPAWFMMVRRRVCITRPPAAPVYEVREFEMEGRDPKTRRARPGAYRKVEFDPDPAFVARARHTYAVWWCAMEWLAAWMEASGRLSNHKVRGPQGVEKPWQSSVERVA